MTLYDKIKYNHAGFEPIADSLIPTEDVKVSIKELKEDICCCTDSNECYNCKCLRLRFGEELV